MSSIQQRGDKFQLRCKHRLLPRPFFFTFDTLIEAENYRDKLDALLARGVVPGELLEAKPTQADRTSLPKVIEQYLQTSGPSPSDHELLKVVAAEVVGTKIAEITYAWVEAYVARCKLKSNLAPSSIRKRVGALARVLDWHHRSTTGRDQVNPFRLLPRGYSTYSSADATKVEPKVDIQRNRRLSPEELQRVRNALAGLKSDSRERPLRVDPEFSMLFELIHGTGLRLQEAYTLRRDQVDLGRWVLQVEGSKGHRGKVKPRVVPIIPGLRDLLSRHCEGRDWLLFPSLWDGTVEGRRKAKSRLVSRFATLFAYAQVPDFVEHDLRHSACCMWFEMRNAQGAWAFSEVEIARLMGWSNLSMVLRYASFRAEDLAARLTV